MEIINKDQIKSIHILLAKKDLIDVKKDYLHHWYGVDSTKSLSYDQANDMIKQLGGEPYVNYEHIKYGRFTAGNSQHYTMLNLAIEIGWTTIHPNTRRMIANIERMGGWIKQYGYLHKPLNQYTASELPKLIHQFKQVVKHHLNTPKPCRK